MFARIGAVAILAALCLAASAPPASTALSPDGIGAPQASGTGPVDWHPIFSGHMGPAPDPMAYDAVHDRILYTATPFDSTGSPLPAVLVTLDSSGNVLANTTLVGPAGWAHSVSAAPALGFGYVSSVGPTITQVDTLTGAILATRTYPFDVYKTVASGGVLYAIAADANGTLPIERIDATTGVVLGNVTGSPPVFFTQMLIDPSGRWLFGSRTNTGETALRMDLTNGSVVDLGLTDTHFTLSADGSRVYICGTGPTRWGLWSFWLSNLTLQPLPATDGECNGPIAANPRTDVVATTGGLLLTPDVLSGRTSLGGSRGGYIQALEWRADGTALISALFFPDGSFEVGTWDGTPHLVQPIPEPPVLNPRFSLACTEILTPAGMNLTDVAVYLDADTSPVVVGATDPFPCVDLTTVSLSDGNHVLRVTGWDLLGQRLNDSVPFVTDGTAPVLSIASAGETNRTPYVVRGYANDSHPGTVTVNGRPATVVGTQWSTSLNLRIGANAVVVNSTDAAGNVASELRGSVRYWPAYLDFDRNATAHFAVPVPPGWSDVRVPLLGGSLEAINLVGPSELPIPPIITVTSLAYANASASSAVALGLARDAQAFVVATGGTVLDPAHVVLVANHSAATFMARVSVSGVSERYIQTVIVAPEWGRVYIATASIPEATWSNHSEDMAWVLGGFRIDAPSAAPPGGESLPVLWWAAGAGAIAGAAALLAVVLWRRRRKGPPTAVPGVEASPPDVRPEGDLEPKSAQDPLAETDDFDWRP